jgi:hypothetical protein
MRTRPHQVDVKAELSNAQFAQAKKEPARDSAITRAQEPTVTERPTAAEKLCDEILKAQSIGGIPVFCEALHLLRERTGQNKYQHAAAIVGGRKPGPPEIDDRAALLRIAACPPHKRREAVGKEAKQMAGGDDAKAKAIAHRLRRKRPKQAAK